MQITLGSFNRSTHKHALGTGSANHRSCLRVRSVSAHEWPKLQVKQQTTWHACVDLRTGVQKKTILFFGQRGAPLC